MEIPVNGNGFYKAEFALEGHNLRFVNSPINPFKISLMRQVPMFFGLLKDWEFVCEYGSYVDTSEGRAFVPAEFKDATEASERSLIELRGTLFVK